MAGVSTKEIKNRIRSMESTKQITKAMEMVAASKLRRAQAQIQNSRPYFEILYSTIQDIVRNNRDFSSPYLKEREVKKVMYIVIAGDRGLAGGYNSNILKLVMTEIQGKDASVLPIGKKAVDYFRSKGIPSLADSYAEAADVSIGDCFSIAKLLSKVWLAGNFDEIHVAYTNFVSVLSQTPATLRLLPRLPKLWAAMIPAGVYLVMMGLCGQMDLLPLPALLLGGVAGAAMPGRQAKPHRRGETGAAQVRLEMVAGVISQDRFLTPSW